MGRLKTSLTRPTSSSTKDSCDQRSVVVPSEESFIQLCSIVATDAPPLQLPHSPPLHHLATYRPLPQIIQSDGTTTKGIASNPYCKQSRVYDRTSSYLSHFHPLQ